MTESASLKNESVKLWRVKTSRIIQKLENTNYLIVQVDRTNCENLSEFVKNRHIIGKQCLAFTQLAKSPTNRPFSLKSLYARHKLVFIIPSPGTGPQSERANMDIWTAAVFSPGFGKSSDFIILYSPINQNCGCKY